MTDHKDASRTPGEPHEDPVRWAARLVRLVERQHGHFVALEALSDRQRAAIDAGDSDALLRVLGERQSIVDLITATGAEISPFQERWDELLRTLDAPARTSLSGRVAELQELSHRVAEHDERDRLALETRRASLVDDLAGVVKSRGALAAYGSRRAGGPLYQDRQG